MNQLDLVWPGVVILLSVVSAIIVRLVATQGERAARARHRRNLDDVWHERRGSGDLDRARGDSFTAENSRTNASSSGP